jgi:uncharacterized protein YggL (DUF469 family)
MKKRHKKKSHKGEFAEYGVAIKFRKLNDKDGEDGRLDDLIDFTEAMDCSVGGGYDESGEDFMIFYSNKSYSKVSDFVKELLSKYLDSSYEWYAISEDIDLYYGDLDNVKFIEKNTGI